MTKQQQATIHARCLICDDWIEADLRSVRQIIGQSSGKLPRLLPLPCITCTKAEFIHIGSSPTSYVTTYHNWAR